MSKFYKYKQYNWVFSGDELILTEFVHEKVTYSGKVCDGEDIILGREKIHHTFENTTINICAII